MSLDTSDFSGGYNTLSLLVELWLWNHFFQYWTFAHHLLRMHIKAWLLSGYAGHQQLQQASDFSLNKFMIPHFYKRPSQETQFQGSWYKLPSKRFVGICTDLLRSHHSFLGRLNLAFDWTMAVCHRFAAMSGITVLLHDPVLTTLLLSDRRSHIWQ